MSNHDNQKTKKVGTKETGKNDLQIKSPWKINRKHTDCDGNNTLFMPQACLIDTVTMVDRLGMVPCSRSPLRHRVKGVVFSPQTGFLFLLIRIPLVLPTQQQYYDQYQKTNQWNSDSQCQSKQVYRYFGITWKTNQMLDFCFLEKTKICCFVCTLDLWLNVLCFFFFSFEYHT